MESLYFDYDLQVWVREGVITDVGLGVKEHPDWIGKSIGDVLANMTLGGNTSEERSNVSGG